MKKRERIEAIFQIWQQHNPNPKTELIYHTPYELLIAVMLSAQATDLSVNKATKTLFACANTPEAMITLGEAALKTHIRHIGLFNSKAKHVMATSRLLIDEHQSQVPLDRAILESFPGVGRKTANVVLNVWQNAPTMPVDTHVFRVAKRLGMAKGKTPLAVEKELLATIPKPYLAKAHHWLILHGRYVCKARKPACSECLIANLCTAPEKT